MNGFHFADAVIARVRALGHPLCVGLDPHLRQVPEVFRRGSMAATDPATVAAVGEFLEVVVDHLEGRVAAVKPQAALFEQMGAAGVALLERVQRRARDRGLLVLLDAKRGDIRETSEGYAAAYLDRGAPLAADALTVNAYLGLETLQPYFSRCRAYGCGVFVLVKTSNPGAGDLQDLQADGEPVFVRLATALAPESACFSGPATGWSSVGAVVGATRPEQGLRVRERLPRALFLIPGYGAQGASASAAVRTFVRGPQGLEGGLVNASRAILFPKNQGVGAASWERALEEALVRAIENLGEALVRESSQVLTT